MTLSVFTLPPSRIVGDPDPPADMNEVVLALQAQNAAYNVMAFTGADPTGTTDSTTAINDALATGMCVLPPGTFLVNSASALSMTVTGSRLAGAGYGLTEIKIGSSFSGTEVINIAAPNCMVDNLAIVGHSSTIASNPACNAIEVEPGSYQYTIREVFTQYVNGYSLEGTNANGQNDISHSVVDKFWSYNCAGAIHYDGDIGSGAQSTVGVTLSNISIGNGGTATGPNANLDAILLDACSDVIFTGCLIGVGSAGTGNCIHIVGNCSAVSFVNFDAGGFPGTLAGSQCGVLIENDTNGLNAQRIRFATGTFQTFGQGAQINGLAQQIGFENVQFINNVTHGAQLAGTGTQINFTDCTFSGNGSGGTGNNYDLNNSGTAQGWVRNSHFLSSIVAMNSGPGVQFSVNMASSGTALNFADNDFPSGNFGNIFTNLPSITRTNKNYNPHGGATVTVPVSGTATTALHYDSTFYITGAAGGTCTITRNTNGQGGGVGPGIVIPNGGCVPVFVAAAANITPVYSSAPTWVVDGM